MGSARISAKLGNLADEDADAIVCPANSYCGMRGGVADAIRRAGGDAIEKEALAKAPVPVGNAIITGAGRLKAKHVIHAPTMRLPAEKIGTENVEKAVAAALRCADENSLRSVSFPGMGTGVGGVAYKAAAGAMLDAIRRHLGQGQSGIERITIVAYSREFYGELNRLLM